MSGSTERPEPATTEIEVPAPRRIAIIGYTESRKEAPWGDPSWEKWLVNDLYRFCPSDDWHRLYDVHALKDIKADSAHDAFLKGGTRVLEDGSGNDVALGERPVYVFKADPEWKTAVAFPKDEVIEAFGDYFTNSISWMTAHAMLEIRQCAIQYAEANLVAIADHAEKEGQAAVALFEQAKVGLLSALIRDYEGTCSIHVYGVDMATAGEYGAQRPSCEWIIGVAQGRGIETHVPLSSDLFKAAAMYGAENDSAMYAKFAERKEELTKRGRHLESTIAQAQTQLHQIQGALETTNYVLNVWCNARGTRDSANETEQLPEAA